MRRVGVVTLARSEYGSCLPILRAIKAESDLSLHLIVGGAHLSNDFGYTISEIEADGFEVNDRVEMLVSSDTPEAIGKTIGLGTIGFAQSFARVQPDILVLVGDRYELLSVASAALPFRIPLAHVSGGDITEGAIDNQVRHAISKMSHIHFVAMQEHADRLIRMGEESWRVHVTGDPALDLIAETKMLSRTELSERLGLDLQSSIILVTFHPTTLGSGSTEDEVDVLLSALEDTDATLIFSQPNADPCSRFITQRFMNFVQKRPRAAFFPNLGQLTYYSLMSEADLMVGNSSSAIWEAPAFHLPAVNIGERQRGRARAGNVVDVRADHDEISAAIQRCLRPAFRKQLDGVSNPYGDGRCAGRIVSTLKNVGLGTALLQKRFSVMPVGAIANSARTTTE